MRNRTSGLGVVADALDSELLAMHRARGEAFKRFWHEQLQLTTLRYGLSSVPGLREIGRRDPRAISLAGYATMTSVLFGAALLPSHEAPALIAGLGGMMQSWAPATTQRLEEAWRTETTQQGHSDAAQGLALLAVERGDLGGIRTAIAQTSAHMGALHALLATLFDAERRIQQRRMAS